jgi:hypothetical protein
MRDHVAGKGSSVFVRVIKAARVIQDVRLGKDKTLQAASHNLRLNICIFPGLTRTMGMYGLEAVSGNVSAIAAGQEATAELPSPLKKSRSFPSIFRSPAKSTRLDKSTTLTDNNPVETASNHSSFRFPQRTASGTLQFLKNGLRTMVPSSCPKVLNAVQWLGEECPKDLLPTILAYAGPKTTAALTKTNKRWNNIVQQESTWKVLCEDFYKVRLQNVRK